MLLSIIVLSYNRPQQIERILKNLLTVEEYSTEFNIIIKDDQSPQRKEIYEIIESYKPKLKFEVIFHTNKVNLGYDRNLLDAFRITNSRYLFLLSDDDYILGKKIPDLLTILRSKEFSVYFSSYISEGKIHRNIKKKYDFNDFPNIIYNSILFSGLIFNRKKVNSLKKDTQFLSDCIYTQVYLTSLLIFKEKSYGMYSDNLLVLGNDGKNYFGKNQSATNSSVLTDRESALSNLNYQIFLLKVVQKVSSQTDKKIYTLFLKEYRIRLIAYAFKVRISGITAYNSFMSHYKKSDLPKKSLLSFFFIFLYLTPGIMSKYIYRMGLNFLRNSG